LPERYSPSSTGRLADPPQRPRDAGRASTRSGARGCRCRPVRPCT